LQSNFGDADEEDDEDVFVDEPPPTIPSTTTSPTTPAWTTTTTTNDVIGNNNNNNNSPASTPKTNSRSTSFFAQPGTLAGIFYFLRSSLFRETASFIFGSISLTL
jgi:hypothetical protein